ncbi:hypothetical protein P4O66_020678 [Electrophorus voltai]|uniref:Uncharacterized protein n=1 Tax=Electrophorus voltai TaxID=2609070 RepID=A0AAD9DLI0_9TELE|nr:hypothetical protein P4O66_020678 [Electrophorus voltai]
MPLPVFVRPPASWGVVVDTLIIDISNAHCGPGSIPGLRLSEGRYSYLSDLPSQAGPRLEVRRGGGVPPGLRLPKSRRNVVPCARERSERGCRWVLSVLGLPTFSLLFSPPAQADHGKVSVLFRYVRERREVVVTCVPPPSPGGVWGGVGVRVALPFGVFLTGRPVRGTSVTSRPVSSLARVKRDSSPNPAVFTLLGNPPERTRERPQIRRDNPLNLSILLSGGKETNKDSLSSGERRGKSPALNPPSGCGRGELGRMESARGIQPGGEAVPVAGSVLRFQTPGVPPSGGRVGGRGGPPRGAGLGRRGGALPPRRCAATGSGSAWKGQGAKVARELRPRALQRPPAPTSPLATRGRGASTSAPSSPCGGRGRGPSAPDAAVDRAGLSSVRRLTAPRRQGGGPALVPKGARGRRRCRYPPDPS